MFATDADWHAAVLGFAARRVATTQVATSKERLVSHTVFNMHSHSLVLPRGLEHFKNLQTSLVHGEQVANPLNNVDEEQLTARLVDFATPQSVNYVLEPPALTGTATKAARA